MKLSAYGTSLLSNGRIVPITRNIPGIPSPTTDTTTSHLITLPLISHSSLYHRRHLEENNHNYNEKAIIYPAVNKMDRIQAYRNRYYPPTRRVGDASKDYYSDDSIDETAALYEGYGTHYVDLWVGTPPQRQTVIVDTGSGVTAFPCKDCSGCGSGYHASPFFQEDQSSTFHMLECSECDGGFCRASQQYCSISVSYAEGSSWSAFQSTDMTYMGGTHFTALSLKHHNGTIHGADPLFADLFRFKMLFGCQTSITGLFISQLADGIMGMSNGHQAIWRQMKNAGVTKSGQFSLCYSLSNEEIVKNGTHAGAITMGGTDVRLHHSPMVFAAANKVGEFHGLTIRKVYLLDPTVDEWENISDENTVRVDVSEQTLNTGGVILDSGTTDTYMNSAIATAFRKAWSSYVDVQYNNYGMKLTKKQLGNLPTILFQFQGIDENGFNANDPDRCVGLAGCLDSNYPNDILVAVPMYQYLTYNAETKEYEPTIFITEHGQTVIGANAMAGHDVLFDTDGSGRIGFAVSNCEYNKLVASIPTSTPTQQNTTNTYDDSVLSKAPTKKPTGVKSPSPNKNDLQNNTNKSQVGITVALMLLVAAVIVFTVIIRRRRKRVKRGTYRQTIGLDELELDDDEDLEIPPVI